MGGDESGYGCGEDQHEDRSHQDAEIDCFGLVELRLREAHAHGLATPRSKEEIEDHAASAGSGLRISSALPVTVQQT